jgi:hypothetical protein
MRKWTCKFEFGKTVGADGLPFDPRQIAKQSAGPIEMLKNFFRDRPAAVGDREALRFLNERAGR